MRIPSIEELDRIGCKAAGFTINARLHPRTRLHLTAIRDAVVAACKPRLRPLAEMPDTVPEGCVRKFAESGEWLLSSDYYEGDTHYIDIALPSPVYPSDFESAFAESKIDAKDKDAAFRLWKGGAR